MFVSPQNSYTETLMCNVVAWGGGASERGLSRERGALLGGISTLITKTPQSSSVFLQDCRCMGQRPLQPRANSIAAHLLSVWCMFNTQTFSFRNFKGKLNRAHPPPTLSLGLSMICPACSPTGLEIQRVKTLGDSRQARGSIFTLPSWL